MNKMALPQRLFRLGGMRAQEHQYLSKAKEEKFPKETEVWSARQEEKKNEADVGITEAKP